MKDEKKIIKYRGVKTAFLVGVVEGDGTSDNPMNLTEYVLAVSKSGVMTTLGKVVPLDENERQFIGFIDDLN